MSKQYNHLTIPEQRAESRRRHEEKFGRRLMRCRNCRMIVDEQTAISHLERCSHMVGNLEAREGLYNCYFEEKPAAKIEPRKRPPQSYADNPRDCTRCGKSMKRGRSAVCPACAMTGDSPIAMPHAYLDVASLDDIGELDGE